MNLLTLHFVSGYTEIIHRLASNNAELDCVDKKVSAQFDEIANKSAFYIV